jgi:hypothetical protein
MTTTDIWRAATGHSTQIWPDPMPFWTFMGNDEMIYETNWFLWTVMNNDKMIYEMNRDFWTLWITMG